MSKLALDIYAEVGVPNSNEAAMASGGGAVRELGSRAELDAAVGGALAPAVHFWAAWCKASKQMDEVFAHLAVDLAHALFLGLLRHGDPRGPAPRHLRLQLREALRHPAAGQHPHHLRPQRPHNKEHPKRIAEEMQKQVAAAGAI
ncbi:uncharacterized protein LOC123396871 [Hordeum vulgare subsp. vulgare]|uniref:uncharacterized protein LOC123396871 n=1 Tax=Hordeum vulgare subsp. vulgare TaxID=112509 RepID=UPI001D1A3E29|nr:uncharacterized protein LOC123396871 [Hordeum vulgare subsp. vulgare]